MSDAHVNRREFIAATLTGAAALALPNLAGGAVAPPMPERALGNTGHRVRIFSLGGQATLEKPGMQDQSVAIINRAIDLGVNYLDTAAAYGRGISQRYIGEVMRTRRREVFLASKTHDRTREGSLRLLEQSLELLQTDHLDLWQLHNISRTEQLDTIFGRNGAIEAMAAARDQKLVRFVGITGHYDPDVLLDGIQRYDFDTILMAMNPADRHFLSFQEKLLPEANRRGMGVIAMKIPARGRVFREGGLTSMKDALGYTLSQPVSTTIVGCDTIAQLEENVRIAQQFRPLSSAELSRIEGAVAGYARDAAFFKRGATGFSMAYTTSSQNTD
ncbi:MAG TPA: aldo/keto reductase [Longimicrobiales bacterium]